jgi:NADH dehydrogenase
MPVKRPHIVIAGAGFGGLAAARALRNADVEVTLIDKRNHHLFQPLLYQVATAGLSPADIAAPIRAIVKNNANTRVLLDRIYGIDTDRKLLTLGNGRPLSYDWLIIATGARHSYFGRDDWAPHAPGVKTIDDATAVRRKVLLALERAETETDKARRDALLTFVIIGGGPTGVEMAGAVAELARQSVSRDFRSITPHCSRIILVDGHERVLSSFPPSLSARAQASIEQLGVELRLSQRVENVSAEGVIAGGTFIPAATAIWAAGVQASPAAEWLGVPSDRAGRVAVGDDLRVPGIDHVFVIGDTASCPSPDGRILPGVAPVAKQQGRYAAKAILAAIAGGQAAPFRYRNYGNLATIGRKRAVADFGRIRLSGFIAWIVWCTAHIWFLAGFRNRFVVGLNWLWNYLTFERNARLITGDVLPDRPPVPALDASSAAV